MHIFSHKPIVTRLIVLFLIKENERLYKQVKELQLNNKTNEEIMFKENRRLMTQLAALQ